MDPTDRVIHNFNESIRTAADAVNALAASIAAAATGITDCLLNDGKVLACGNGGSATDAQHFSCEMLNRFETERPGLPAISLTADSATLTAIANDSVYADVFAKQVRALGRTGDMLLAITTSGNSASVLHAVQAAHEQEMRCIALSGRDGGELSAHLSAGDIHLCVPGASTARIQEVHRIVIHCLCDLVDHQLLGG